jgi:uncharacterized heparinase superfamily protein
MRRLEQSQWYDVARRVNSIGDRVVAGEDRVATPCDLATDDTEWKLLEELKRGKLTLLNVQRPFRGGDDWCMTGGREKDRLWKYTLHYHGWLVRLAHGYATTGDNDFGEQIATQLGDWIRHCPPGEPGFTHYAWNSYAIATRLENWRQLLNFVPPKFWDTRGTLLGSLSNSMASQAAYLSRHIEWDLRGNHLLRDALGLASAAQMFEGREPQHWMKQAERIVAGQLDEQILPDGMHFERSAAYHLEVMRDLVKLASLLHDQSVVTRIQETSHTMAEAVAWLRHPDGRVVQFNDGASCVADQCDLRPRRGGRWFKSSGIVAWHGDPWTVFYDVGDVGPTFQPGHAHADTLTIECSFKGKRLFVDPGCHSYDLDDLRKYDRSTAAHNTVCIDHTDSSEVWHIFRVGRRARPAETNVDIRNSSIHASATHSGYDHLPGAPRHQRQIVIHDNGPLQVTDDITGAGQHHVEGGFLLDPQWIVETSDNGWLLRNGDTSLRVQVDSACAAALDVRPATVHPDYGVELKTQRLCWTYQGPLPLQVCMKVTNSKSPTPIKSQIPITKTRKPTPRNPTPV